MGANNQQQPPPVQIQDGDFLGITRSMENIEKERRLREEAQLRAIELERRRQMWGQQPNPVAQQLNSFLMGGYLQGPQNMNNQIMGAFANVNAGNQAAYAAARERQLAQNISNQEFNFKSKLVDALTKGNGGMGQSISGFRAPSSGQSATLGQINTGINPVRTPQAALDAAGMYARGQGMAAPRGLSPAVAGQVAAVSRMAGSDAANEAERATKKGFRELGLQSMVRRADAGVDMGNYLAGLAQDAARRNIMVRSPLTRALGMGLRS